jgi:DNA-binding beta-propeller fold protein YncE
VPVAEISGLAASPASSFVFVSQQRGEKLAVIDLNAGKVVKELAASQLRGAAPVAFNKPSLTPDGRYLFCEGFEFLHRFRVEGANLIYEQSSARIGANPQRIDISFDSQYVAMPSSGGNGHNGKTIYTTHVYRVNDLTRPAMILASGAYPKSVTFDKAAGRIYTQNAAWQLVVFTPSGQLEKSYKILPRGVGADVPQVLAHPLGHKVLILTSQRLLWLVWPATAK